jgi:hypothetical protein
MKQTDTHFYLTRAALTMRWGAKGKFLTIQ